MLVKLAPKPRVHNKFEFIVKDTSTGEVVQKEVAYNIALHDQIKAAITNTSSNNGVDGLRIGRGTGELSPSRTTLFNQIAQLSVTLLERGYDLPTSHATWKATIGETQYVGETITEIGLNLRKGTSTNFLISHALIEDSEGNPISIGPKTDTQIIEITATAYVTMENGPGMGLDWVGAANAYSGFILATNDGAPGFTLRPNGVGSVTVTRSAGTLTGVASRVLSTSGNRVSWVAEPSTNPWIQTTDILALDITNYARVRFPNTALFPQMAFDDVPLGVGDGVSTLFRFPTGFYDIGTVEIRVDDVVQVEGTDYLLSQGARQVVNFTDVIYPGASESPELLFNGTTPLKNEMIGNFPSTDMWSPNFIVVDLKQSIIVGALHHQQSTAFTQTLTFQSSDDGVTWVAWGSLSCTNTARTEHIPPRRTRYIRVTMPQWSLNRLCFYGLWHVQFITPPANGAEVVGDYKTSIPPKNSNYAYDGGVIVQWPGEPTP